MATKIQEKQKHLGRGLSSLLSPITSSQGQQPPPGTIGPAGPNFSIDKELRESLRDIKIDSIEPNPYQPRTLWDEEQLEDLAQSIRTNGVLQPIIARPMGQKFQIIAGERRVRASELAGLDVIPALVRKATDDEMLELALVENVHRQDLNPIERAKAYKTYLETFSMTQAEAAERIGENRSVIANYIRLLDLPTEVRQMLIDEKLTMGHARAMLALPTDDLRRKLASRAMAGRLSVREVERLVRRYTSDTQKDNKSITTKPAHILDLEERLKRELGTKVVIEARKNGQRGKVIIEFYSIDDFERITEKLGVSMLEEV